MARDNEVSESQSLCMDEWAVEPEMLNCFNIGFVYEYGNYRFFSARFSPYRSSITGNDIWYIYIWFQKKVGRKGNNLVMIGQFPLVLLLTCLNVSKEY